MPYDINPLWIVAGVAAWLGAAAIIIAFFRGADDPCDDYLPHPYDGTLDDDDRWFVMWRSPEGVWTAQRNAPAAPDIPDGWSARARTADGTEFVTSSGAWVLDRPGTGDLPVRRVWHGTTIDRPATVDPDAAMMYAVGRTDGWDSGGSFYIDAAGRKVYTG